MREALYNSLRSQLSQDARNRVKRRVAHTRHTFAPLYRFRFGEFGADELHAELARRVPRSAEIIMVHCSLNDLQPMYSGTVRELLDVCIELCRPDRTLAMPAFVFGGRSYDPYEYYRRHPLFDARRQPSEMGLLSEIFRRHDGVRRSLHPTASVCALGPLAEELVSRHHLAGTTFGRGTPFGVMAEHDTAIIGIGSDYFRCLSQVHAAEDLLGHRFPIALERKSVAVQIRARDGTMHEYDLRVTDPKMRRRIELLHYLLDPTELVRWRFKGVRLFVVSADRVTEALVQAALRGETIYDAMPIRRSRPVLGDEEPPPASATRLPK